MNAIQQALNALASAQHWLMTEKARVEAPIPMILFCPHCCVKHIDKEDVQRGWHNPPHRSHLCAGCGFVWRPADVFTMGVHHIKTVGQKDNLDHRERDKE